MREKIIQFGNLVVCTSVHVRFCHLQNKQGEIKHVYRGNVFLQAKGVLENGGVIVCKAKHVELAGGTSNAVSQGHNM